MSVRTMAAAMAQLVEHILGKDEVPSSNLGSSSKQKTHPIGCVFCLDPPLFDSNCVFAPCAQNPVRLPRSKIGMRTCLQVFSYQAQGAGIFAIGEYLGSSMHAFRRDSPPIDSHRVFALLRKIRFAVAAQSASSSLVSGKRAPTRP